MARTVRPDAAKAWLDARARERLEAELRPTCGLCGMECRRHRRSRTKHTAEACMAVAVDLAVHHVHKA